MPENVIELGNGMVFAESLVISVHYLFDDYFCRGPFDMVAVCNLHFEFKQKGN